MGAFEDTRRWSEAVNDFHGLARDNRMTDTMEGLRLILGEGPKLAYLSYMMNRLRECWQVLKPTGSLHCDSTMNYLLRVILEAISANSGRGGGEGAKSYGATRVRATRRIGFPENMTRSISMPSRRVRSSTETLYGFPTARKRSRVVRRGQQKHYVALGEN